MRILRLGVMATAMSIALGPALSASLRGTIDEGGNVDFAREVRPILSRACFACHGPDDNTREADLRLDLRESALADLGGYHAVVPGDPEESELIIRITDEFDLMPPEDSGFELTADEIELLRRWVEEDAPYQEHWAFVPPTLEQPPATADVDWSHNEVDAFVLARLESEGLAPRQTADRRTLIRRVTIDLTGLPPTPKELAAFLEDEQPNAYRRLVERLLASSSYGEHMARTWLDIARYGDTHGLHLDNYREMWPYRDIVIQAFNDNQPYDEFVIEQLAGDMLPNATLDQQIASGFNRCNVTTSEGGSIAEEVYVRNVVDRVSTTGAAFMGLTLGCAVCHNHKFDPISQAEFYGLFAYFNNVEMEPLDGNVKDHAPVVRVPSEEQSTELNELNFEHEVLEAHIAEALRAVVYNEPGSLPRADVGSRMETVWVEDSFPTGAEVEGDGLLWTESPTSLVHSGQRSMRRTAQGLEQHFFRSATRKLRIGAEDQLFAWVHLDPENPPRQIMLQFNGDGDQDWEHRAYWGEDLIPFGTAGPSRRARGELPQTGAWVRLAVPAAELGFSEGDVIYGAAFTQFDGTVHWDRLGISSEVEQDAQDFVWIEDEAPESSQAGGDTPDWNWIGREHGPVLSGERSLRRSREGLSQDYFTMADPLVLRSGDRLFAHVWLDPTDPPSSVQLQFNDGSWGHRVRWGAPAHGAGREGAEDFVAGPLPPPGKWVRLEVDLSDVGLSSGSALNGWAFTQVDGNLYWDRAGVNSWGLHSDQHLYSQLAWEARALGHASLPADVAEAAGIARAERSAEQVTRLREHYLRNIHAGTRKSLEPQLAEVLALDTQITKLRASIPTTLVMKERVEPRLAYLLERGQYDARGEPVPRSLPAILPTLDAALSNDRLGLARWLVTPGHPLTSRVAVNRMWQQVFGTGIVRTGEDFGNQGEQPSHPKLLDWLAVTFEREGWDRKRMLRRLVTSATYQQDSGTNAELTRRDPGNRLLARGPRYRWDAEVIRDQALALAGLLHEKIGGPGVKPPQPGGLWSVVAYTGSNTNQFVADSGPEKVHRRSLYTFFKRTAPPPQMSTFDAPSREDCRTRRERTNTPLQALLLMNDPQFIEAAGYLALRTLAQGGSTPEQQAAFMFELCTMRPPTALDLEDMLGLFHTEREAFRQDPKGAQALVSMVASNPEAGTDPALLAAWTIVANLVLNLDEVLVKG